MSLFFSGKDNLGAVRALMVGNLEGLRSSGPGVSAIERTHSMHTVTYILN